MHNSDIYKRVLTTITHHSLFDVSAHSLIVGVSGGVDSMVLLKILHAMQCRLHIAHCNFNLRAEESDADQELVTQFAKRNNIPISTISFDTIEHARQHKISIEMAARNLRYEWFETLRSSKKFTHIAVAHNENDSVETFFINLFRSAGLKGLRGIPITNQYIVRPLLEVPRADIELCAKNYNIPYRTDHTNLENDFERNKIRNIILPLLRDVYPHAQTSIVQVMSNIQNAYSFYAHSAAQALQTIVTYTDRSCEIDELALANHAHAQILLYECLTPYNFNATTITTIYSTLNSQSGKRFESPTHIAYRDRGKLYILPQEDCTPLSVEFSCHDTKVHIGEGYLYMYIKKMPIEIEKNATKAYFDNAKLPSDTFICRTWKQGDAIKPWGMKGTKKISDYLIDKKIPQHIKQRTLVLESAGVILWLLPHTIHSHYGVDAHTKEVLVVEYKVD